MLTAIEVRFLDESGNIRAGELVNPARPNYEDGTVEVEFVGDNEVDILSFRSNNQPYFFRTHISRVASMREVVLV
jgi:hypothetical protein